MPHFLTLGYGLLAAAAWGSADFGGGLAARRLNVFAAVVASQATGLILLGTIAVALATPLPGTALLWAAAAGVAGAIGLVALWRALSVGPMGIGASVSAVVAAAGPVIYGGLAEGLPRALHTVGFLLASTGIWLVSRPGGAARRPQGLAPALLAGLGFGLYFILIEHATAASTVWPLLTARAVSFFITVAIALRARAPLMPRAAVLPFMIAAGTLDITGNFAFVLAAQAGRLDLSVVAASLYPAVTALLARIFAGERTTPRQTAGIGTMLAAIVLLAMP